MGAGAVSLMHLRRSDNCDKSRAALQPPRLVLAVGLVTFVVASLLHKIHHLPDFAAVWRNRPGDEKAKIHDEHFGSAEAYVDGFVEAVEDISGRKDYRRRVHGVSDEVAHHPGAPVNAGDFKTGQACRPGAGRNGAGLGDEDITLEAKSLCAGEIEHIGRGVQLNFREGRLDLQLRPETVRKGELRAR